MFPGSVFVTDPTSREHSKGSVAVALLLAQETGTELKSSDIETKAG